MELYTSWQYNEKHDADYANQQHKPTAKQIVRTKWDKNIIQQLLRAKQHIARSGEKSETKIIKNTAISCVNQIFLLLLQRLCDTNKDISQNLE